MHCEHQSFPGGSVYVNIQVSIYVTQTVLCHLKSGWAE